MVLVKYKMLNLNKKRYKRTIEHWGMTDELKKLKKYLNEITTSHNYEDWYKEFLSYWIGAGFINYDMESKYKKRFKLCLTELKKDVKNNKFTRLNSLWNVNKTFGDYPTLIKDVYLIRVKLNLGMETIESLHKKYKKIYDFLNWDDSNELLFYFYIRDMKVVIKDIKSEYKKISENNKPI